MPQGLLRLRFGARILQRKLLTPNDFCNLETLKQRLLEFIAHYNRSAKPINWSYTVTQMEKNSPRTCEILYLDLAEGFRQVTGITPILQIDLHRSVSLSVSRTIHRIVQEALTNISKHAQATQVQIDLVTIRQASGDCLCLTLKDNGKGFDCQQHTAGFGLQGMQERVAALAGEFHLTTAPGAGCQIEVRCPFA